MILKSHPLLDRASLLMLQQCTASSVVFWEELGSSWSVKSVSHRQQPRKHRDTIREKFALTMLADLGRTNVAMSREAQKTFV